MSNTTQPTRTATILPTCPDCGTVVPRIEKRAGSIQCANVNRCGLMLATTWHDHQTGRDGLDGRYAAAAKAIAWEAYDAADARLAIQFGHAR